MFESTTFFFPDTALVYWYVSGESETFWIRSSEWKFLNRLWTRNRVDAKSGFFSSGDVTKSSRVLYCEYGIQDGRLVSSKNLWMHRLTQRVNKTDWCFLAESLRKRCWCQTSLEVGIKTRLNARLEIRQRGDLFEINISAKKISILQGQSYTEREYYNGSSSLNSNFTSRYSRSLRIEANTS